MKIFHYSLFQILYCKTELSFDNFRYVLIYVKLYTIRQHLLKTHNPYFDSYEVHKYYHRFLMFSIFAYLMLWARNIFIYQIKFLNFLHDEMYHRQKKKIIQSWTCVYSYSNLSVPFFRNFYLLDIWTCLLGYFPPMFNQHAYTYCYFDLTLIFDVRTNSNYA